MDWNGIHRHFAALHHTSPSKQAKVKTLLDNVAENLLELEKMGHVLHLAEGKGEDWAEWPRLMYHLTLAPNGRQVTSEDEAKALGAGWFYTAEDAQSAGVIPLSPAQMAFERERNAKLQEELRLPSSAMGEVDPLDPVVVDEQKAEALRSDKAKTETQSPPLQDKPLGGGLSGNDEGEGRKADQIDSDSPEDPDDDE